MYSVCGPFTKNKERIQKFEETEDSRYIYQNEADIACFQLDMAYGDFKNLIRRTTSDEILRDKAFNIAKNPNYDGYKCRFASIVHKLFDKETSGSDIKNENISNKELSDECINQLLKKITKRKVQLPFVDNIGDADLVDMKLISKFNKVFRFFLRVIDIYSKYALVIALKDKKGANGKANKI